MSDASVVYVVHTIIAGLLLYGIASIVGCLIVFGIMRWKKWI